MSATLSRPFPGQRILDWINLNFQALSPLRIIAGAGIRMEWGPGYVIIHSRSSAAPAQGSFDIGSIDGAKVTLIKGALRCVGLFNAILPDTDVTISSTLVDHPTWVYLPRVKSTGAVKLECTDTDGGPVDTSDVWCFPLYCMHLDSTATAVLDHDWRLDVRTGTPIG